MSSNFELKTDEYLQQCDLKDVISFGSEKWVSIGKIKKNIYQSFVKYKTKINKNISKSSKIKHEFSWFEQGENCEILRAGSQEWQRGKIKINVTLEFIPDEPEKTASPLDEVRQEINTNNI